MAAPAPSVRYRKLPGQGSSLVGYTTLHQGLDHLLQVNATGYSESYKRFYFRDIQAFLVVRTGYWTLAHVLTGVVGFGSLSLSLIFLVTGNPDWQVGGYIMGSVALALAVALGFSLLAGPACRCAIRTAVQTERLPSLSRLRRARRVIERLRPAIEEAQAQLGTVSAGPISAAAEPAASLVASEAPAPPSEAAPDETSPTAPSV